MRLRAFLLIFVVLNSVAIAPHKTVNPIIFAKLSKTEVINGGVLWLEIDAMTLTNPEFELTSWFGDQQLPLFSFPERKNILYGLIGIPYHFNPKKTFIHLTWLFKNKFHEKKLYFHVIDGNYKSETLKVDERRVKPLEQDLARIQKEKLEMEYLYGSFTPVLFWNDNFQKPIASPITSLFGTKRLFNNQLQSFHSGVDLRAAISTEIFAANAGIVKSAKNYFFSGNTVILDHGFGVYTSYSHLSKFQVKFGEFIKKGQLIGLSGDSGRVNGPHLHWAAKIHNAQVDPLLLLDTIAQLNNKKIMAQAN